MCVRVCIVQCLGEDVHREGLIKTPMRMAKALLACTSGYKQTAAEVVSDAIFTCESNEMVIVRDIECHSMCEHHMLPFFGRVHIAYLPAGRVVGLSKLARLTNVFSKRLQIQERLTHQIAESVQEAVTPRGVAVMVQCSYVAPSAACARGYYTTTHSTVHHRAHVCTNVVLCRHMCMCMRGVEKPSAVTVTTAYTGEFSDSAALRTEFLAMLNVATTVCGPRL